MSQIWSSLENRYVEDTSVISEQAKVLIGVGSVALFLLTIVFVNLIRGVDYGEVSNRTEGIVLDKAVDIQMKMDSIRETKYK